MEADVENFTDGPGDRGHSDISMLKGTLYFEAEWSTRWSRFIE